MKTYITNSEKETFKLAQKIAATLKGGETLCLIGELGSGKTVFVKGLAKGLGVKDVITSPTFVLMKVYQTRKQESKKTKKQKNKLAISHAPYAIRQLVHIDAYRLTNGRDLKAIGVGDYFNNPSTIVVIEWADRVKDILPKKIIKINFKVTSVNKREINII